YFAERPDFLQRGPIGPGRPFQPALVKATPGPWRKLVVDVGPDQVIARWAETDRAALEQIEVIPADKLERYLGDLVRLNMAQLKNFPLTCSPRLGFGLFVNRGKASFRRIAIHPADNL